MMKPKTIALIVVAALCLIILIQNTQVTTVRLLFWSFSLSQIILIFFMLAVGLLAGYLVATLKRRQ